MLHEDQEDSRIGMRLYQAMAAVSEVGHNAEIAAEIGGNASGEWGVASDSLWQIKAILEKIVVNLGVKTPDDLRRINAHDYPPGADNNDKGVPF